MQNRNQRGQSRFIRSGRSFASITSELPYSVAMEMALTGQPITSDEAKNYGLVSRVTDNGGTIDAALD